MYLKIFACVVTLSKDYSEGNILFLLQLYHFEPCNSSIY